MGGKLGNEAASSFTGLIESGAALASSPSPKRHRQVTKSRGVVVCVVVVCVAGDRGESFGKSRMEKWGRMRRVKSGMGSNLGVYWRLYGVEGTGFYISRNSGVK